MVRDAMAARTEIEKLRFQLARFKRIQFGQSSEKVERTVEQLELAIETLEEGDFLINNDPSAINPKRTGSKAAFQYTMVMEAGATEVIRLRLTDTPSCPGRSRRGTPNAPSTWRTAPD